MSGPTRLIRGVHHAHALPPDHRPRPRGPRRACEGCGCILRASNPDTLCAPCGERAEQQNIPRPPAPAPPVKSRPPKVYGRDPEGALARPDVQAALRFIAAMDVDASRTRYDLRRRRHGLLSASRLRELIGGWRQVRAEADRLVASEMEEAA